MSSKEFKNFMKGREKQIKKAQQQHHNPDFNVYNYNIEELAAILKFEHIPLNKGIINRRIVDLKRKFKNQQKYLKFFDEAEKRLLENFKSVNQETWMEAYEKQRSAANNVLEEQFQYQDEKEKKEKINQIINKENL